jgi:hypothetical protein
MSKNIYQSRHRFFCLCYLSLIQKDTFCGNQYHDYVEAKGDKNSFEKISDFKNNSSVYLVLQFLCYDLAVIHMIQRECVAIF